MILLALSWNLVPLYVFLGVVGAIALIALPLAIADSIRNKKVLSFSPYLASLKALSESYRLLPLQKNQETITFALPSKKVFDKFNVAKHFEGTIASDLAHFKSIVRMVETNKETFARYQKELGALSLTEDESFAKKNGMSLKSFQKRELKFGKKLLIKQPKEYSLTLERTYTSPAGRNHYVLRSSFSYAKIKEMVTKLTSAPKWAKPLDKATKKVERKPEKKAKGKIGSSLTLEADLEEIE